MHTKQNLMKEEHKKALIGCNYATRPTWKIAMAIPFIYLPIIFSIPFTILGAVLVRLHLKYIGGMHIKRFKDFLPTKESYRYNIKSQITPPRTWYSPRSLKSFWIFNCNLYCTYNIALLSYFTYLVRIVENWWCPFKHDKKHLYKDSAIDKSLWHTLPGLDQLLHENDKEDPMWNEDALRERARAQS